MSSDIINLFTSNKNIQYLQYYFNKNLQDGNAKDQILENLIENVFNYNDYNTIENDIYNMRQSIDKWSELRKLNRAFIENRLALYNQYNEIGNESYHMQMFTNDSLQPRGYHKLNDTHIEDENKRIFRFNDLFDNDRSSIPINQRLSRKIKEEDSLYTDSLNNFINTYITEPKLKDNLTTLSYNDKSYFWFDI